MEQRSAHLSALEDVPRILSNEAIAHRFHRLDGDPTGEQAGRLRDARLLGFALFLRCASRPVYRSRADRLWELELPLDPAALCELTSHETHICERALDDLVALEVIERRVSGRAERVLFAREVCAPAPGALDVDWGAVAHTLAGDRAALLVFRALFQLLGHPAAEFTALANADLRRATNYSDYMVRKGRRTLRDLGLLWEERESGGKNLYRFSKGLFRGAPWPETSSDQPEEKGPDPKDRTSMDTGGRSQEGPRQEGVESGVEPPSEHASRATAELRIGGQTLDLGPRQLRELELELPGPEGLTLRTEEREEGGYWLDLGALGRIRFGQDDDEEEASG